MTTDGAWLARMMLQFADDFPFAPESVADALIAEYRDRKTQNILPFDHARRSSRAVPLTNRTSSDSVVVTLGSRRDAASTKNMSYAKSRLSLS